MHSKFFRGVLAMLLAAILSVGGVPATMAYADTSEEIQARLDQAKADLDALYEQAEEAAEEYNHTQVLLDETNAQIEATQEEIAQTQAALAEARAVLGERMAANYKAGGVSFLSIIFQASSFDELVSNIYYADKIAKSDAEAIETVKTLKAELQNKENELEAKRNEQEELLAQQQEQKAELDRRAAEAETYVANLDQELQDKLEEERIAAEEAARKAAEEEAARLAAEQAAREAEEAAQQQAQQQESGDEGGDGGSSVDYSGDWRSVVVSAAYSRVGCSYVYAAGGPNSFDCSGLTSWCYAQAGIGIGHSSGSQSGFCTKPASQAVAGDVVWRPGHVGICIGNGQTIEAFSPGQGVGFGSVYSFQTAGSPVG
ncbi:MAG: hypothetical protein E7Z98_09010 [Olsenella sp.]|nr:hypothetical protein [Olsenella sp.]